MLMVRLMTAGSRNFCRKAFVIYHGTDISLISYGIAICTIKKNGSLVMECNDLSVADKRHLKTFLKRFKHRLS